jgi:hypothetical protein
MRKLLISAFGAVLVGLTLIWSQPSTAWLAQHGGTPSCNTVGVNFTASGTASAAFNFTASGTGGKFNFTCN